jgi:hypothetical protein
MIGRKSLRGWGRTGRFKQKEEVEEGEEEIKKKRRREEPQKPRPPSVGFQLEFSEIIAIWNDEIGIIFWKTKLNQLEDIANHLKIYYTYSRPELLYISYLDK